MTTALDIQHLSVALPPDSDRPFALRDVSLRLEAGRVLCVVGESGSGKSMTASAVMRLLPDGVRVTEGQVRLGEQDLLALSEPAMRQVRGARVAMIFQEPMTALNPLRTVGDQVEEVFRIHRPAMTQAERRERALALFAEVRLPTPETALQAYPNELSGGQRQRAMIAMALALEPEVLIADEPTTALDVTTQAQILQLIRDLQTRHGTAVLFITHDFGVVAEIADFVAVMQAGEVVEQGDADAVLTRPQHHYTRSLIAAVPPPTLAAGRPVAPPSDPVLTVGNLVKTFGGRGLFRRGRRVVRALDDVSLSLPRGQTVGIVGESGSGKSTLARCIVRLLAPESGSVVLDGVNLTTLPARRLRQETRRIQMVFQDPYASLNPRRRVGDLVAQGPLVHGIGPAEAKARVRELFALMGLRPEMANRYPHEFSGGQRQRIGLARALALQPEVLVADEAVSALDVSVQAQVLQLLAELRARLALSVLFITHDLRLAAQVSDRIVVMHGGRVVEEGPVASVFGDPQHEYTRALLAAIPGRGRTGRLQ